MPSNCMPSDYIPFNYVFYTTYKDYYFFTKFIRYRLRAPYKTYKSYKVNPLFTLLTYYFFNSIYIGEKKGIVLMTFSGSSAAYKPNYNYYYFCYCFHYYFCYCFHYYFCYCFRYCFRYYFRRCFSPNTARINPATTTRINPTATCYGPPYYKAARL